MRIGVISERPWAPDVRLRKLLDELRAHGHALFVLSGGRETATTGISGDGVAYSERPIPVGFSKEWTLEFLREMYLSRQSPWRREVEDFHREVRPDVLYVNDLPLSAVVCRVAAERSIPVVVDYHHEGWPEMVRALAEIRGAAAPWWPLREEVFGIWEEVERVCFEGASRILIVDEVLVPVMRGRGCPEDKLVVVRNTPRPGDLPSPNGHRQFPALTYDLGYFGSFDLMKDIPGLVRAVAGIPQSRRPKLLLAGAGEQEPILRSLISHLGQKRNVLLLGWQPKERFGELIEACKVCLIPLRLNGFTHQTSPNKIFEYMYFGRPILSAPARHVSSILNATGTGAACGLDEDSFEEVVDSLCRADASVVMGEKGRAAVSTLFRWAEDAERLRRVFN